MQAIKAEIEIQIPSDYTLIKTTEFEELQQRADYDSWWTFKEVKKRYNHDINWFKANVFYQPKFKNRLVNCVKFPVGKGSSWEFEPIQFSRFMRENFKEICND